MLWVCKCVSVCVWVLESEASALHMVSTRLTTELCTQILHFCKPLFLHCFTFHYTGSFKLELSLDPLETLLLPEVTSLPWFYFHSAFTSVQDDIR